MMELEVQGIDVEEAIKKGLALLNTERENIIVKILDEGSPGLFGLEGAKPARVKLLLKEDLPLITV
ncbi:MAG: Jag N-terminal domain-containing protein [Elusimicrobiota bacterium]